MNPLWFASLLAVFLVLGLDAQAETETVSVEGGMEVEITYPGEIVAGREGIVSILVKNNGWEDKQDISFAFSLPDVPSITVDPSGGITIDRLAQGGSYGKNVSLHVAEEVRPGIYFLNTRYMHTLIANNETPQEPFIHDIAIPITIKKEARVTIITSTPESIFANAQFPIGVEVISEDIDITDVRIRMVPPDDIEFLGETLYVFSRIEKGCAGRNNGTDSHPRRSGHGIQNSFRNCCRVYGRRWRRKDRFSDGFLGSKTQNIHGACWRRRDLGR